MNPLRREREKEGKTYVPREEKIRNKKHVLNSVIELKRQKGCEVNKGTEIQKAEGGRERERE